MYNKRQLETKYFATKKDIDNEKKMRKIKLKY